MKQPYADVLDDYFDALLDESPALAAGPEQKTAAAPEALLQLEPVPYKVEPAPLAAAPYAEPDAAQRRQALEALLAQVAALKEEETAATAVETQTLPKVLAAPFTEPEPAPLPAVSLPIVQPKPVVAPITVAPIAEPVIEVKVDVEAQALLAAEQALAAHNSAWRNMDTEHSFQVLFFEVAGMTFAVPLTHLGGIYQVSKLTSLFGKPDWFSGVQTERDRQIYAVDTARWAMPGHTAKEEYGYLVTLGESHWGLGCHQLKGTALLTRDQVKWRATPGARPWLAGMVKERMCALLHVDALIALLEQGKNIDGQQV